VGKRKKYINLVLAESIWSTGDPSRESHEVPGETHRQEAIPYLSEYFRSYAWLHGVSH